MIEIPDQADPDGLGIHVRSLAMGPVLLFEPARGGLDLAVLLAAGAIVNDKVVAHALVPSLAEMMFVELQGGTAFRGAVVDDDIFPFFAREQRDHGFDRSGVGDAQFLAVFDIGLVGQKIGTHDHGDWNTVHLADPPECFSRGDRVHHIPAECRTGTGPCDRRYRRRRRQRPDRGTG